MSDTCTSQFHLKNDLKIIFETLHLPDRGDSDNVLEWDASIYKKIQVHRLNIVGDKKTNLGDKTMDPVSYRSQKTGRGPLEPSVREMNTVANVKVFKCKHFLSRPG